MSREFDCTCFAKIFKRSSSEALGPFTRRLGRAQETGVTTKCNDAELFSMDSASAIFKTFRAYTNRVYWKSPQVPTNGQSRVRANSIPRSIPVKLL